MVVLTSIFVTRIEIQHRRNGMESIEWDLSEEEQRSTPEQIGRELISMYQVKNRVEPIE